jgi:hypothetical protein
VIARRLGAWIIVNRLRAPQPDLFSPLESKVTPRVRGSHRGTKFWDAAAVLGATAARHKWSNVLLTTWALVRSRTLRQKNS